MKKKQEKIDFSETFSSNVYGGHVCGQSFWVCKTPSKRKLDSASSMTIDEDYVRFNQFVGFAVAIRKPRDRNDVRKEFLH